MNERLPTPEEAIAKGLHVGGFRTPLRSPGYRRPRAVLEDGSVVVRDSDCEPERSEQVWSRDQWSRAVEVGGLWRRVGMWDFVPWDDPAAEDVAFAHRRPDAAGWELWAARERLRRLKWVVTLYDLAVIRREEAHGDWIRAPLDDSTEAHDTFCHACERVDRIRRWLP